MAESNSNKGNYTIKELSEYLDGFLNKPRDVHGDTKIESAAGSNIVFDHNKIEAIVEYLKQLDETNSKSMQLEAEKKKVEDDLHKCETELSKKNLELEKTKDELSRNNSEFVKIKEEFSSNEKSEKKAKKALNAKSEEIERLKVKNKKIKEERDSLRNDLIKKTTPSYNYHKVETLHQTGDHGYKEQNQKLLSENEELIKKYRELQDINNSLKKELADERNRNIDLENQLNSLHVSSSPTESFAFPVQEQSSVETDIQHNSLATDF